MHRVQIHNLKEERILANKTKLYPQYEIFHVAPVCEIRESEKMFLGIELCKLLSTMRRLKDIQTKWHRCVRQNKACD